NTAFDISEAHVLGIARHRHYQPPVGRYGNTYILVTVIHNVVAINRSVNSGEATHIFHSRFHEATHEAQTSAVVGFLELVFVFSAQIHHRLHVHFVESGEHGSGIGSLEQTLGNTLAQTSHGYAFFNTIAHGFDS